MTTNKHPSESFRQGCMMKISEIKLTARHCKDMGDGPRQPGNQRLGMFKPSNTIFY